jgi:hypothetical protein
MKDLERKIDSILEKLGKLEPAGQPERRPRPNEPAEEKPESGAERAPR